MGQSFSKTSSINGCYALNPERKREEEEEEIRIQEQRYHHNISSNSSSSCNNNNRANNSNCQLNSDEALYSTFTTSAELNICEPNSLSNNNNISQIDPLPPTSSSTVTPAENTLSTTALSSSCPRQIIIKIQLAKMESDYQPAEQTHTADSGDLSNNNNNNLSPTNNNNQCNKNQGRAQVLNVKLNEENLTNDIEFTTTTTSTTNSSPHLVIDSNCSPKIVVTAASPPNRQEDYKIYGEFNLNERRLGVRSSEDSSGGESIKVNETNICSVEEQRVAVSPTQAAAMDNCGNDVGTSESDHCCRRKSKSNALPSKWRYCKCTCRDAFKRIMDGPSTSSAAAASATKSNKKKERKETGASSTMKTKSPQKEQRQPQQPQQHSNQQTALWTTLQSNSNNNELQATSDVATTSSNNASAHMSIWSPSRNDVIIPLSSPQFVVVQCPPSSLVTLGRIDDNAIRLMATELVPGNSPLSAGSDSANVANVHVTATSHVALNSALLAASANSPTSVPSSTALNTPSSLGSPCQMGAAAAAPATSVGPVVHSQVDYIHCLVPDLERIIKASFYWGKMDRYEAERLLEGKPEGTFLLRDSAQEEYLFSVTFRKYGRSLHARIEQINHKFSFDCHDPCVFTASTVTGLLEHYKDPACVMFFEPMLTIPLHRNSTFTLQQLCRATIVSHTSYDGINELELPARLKSYLKEYHYKQKLRVKPFDEPFYTCT